MAEFRSAPSQAGGLLPVKTGACPCVAELIDYAQGSVGQEERQRIDTHLQSTSCGYCRGWIDKAAPLEEKKEKRSQADTVVPASKWQQHALRDLESRLNGLEDS